MKEKEIMQKKIEKENSRSSKTAISKKAALKEVNEKEKAKTLTEKPIQKTVELQEEKKPEIEEVKKELVKKKPKEKIMLVKQKKPEEVKKLRDKIKEKKKKPVFRGRFGCKKIRKKSIKKFNKWRHPRGIDIKRKKEDGKWPRPGFGFKAETKTVHPSGFKEVLVSNPKQVQNISKNESIRISRTVGWKKRKEIVKEANRLGVHVLNY